MWGQNARGKKHTRGILGCHKKFHVLEFFFALLSLLSARLNKKKSFVSEELINTRRDAVVVV